MNALVIDKLQLAPQTIDLDTVRQYSHLHELEDELSYEKARPTILIGQDNWHLIVSREVVQKNRDQPAASYTKLGWVLHGRENGIARPVHVINYIAREPSAEDEIGKLIKENFSIECLGIEAKKPSNDLEQRALKVLDDTSRRLPDGRFEIGLIWKTDNEIMPDNKRYAEKRLCNLEKKFKKNKIFYNEYKLQIANLLEKRYAEPAPEAPASPRTWYLPHFAVVHPQKGKIRLVFDAAARTAGRSLNDALLPGPDLLQSLFGILLRFREGRVAVVADIREMFLQVKIREEDRDSLRFLWRENENEEPKEFRMNSLIFGASSSPCSAIYVKNKNAQEFADKYPDAALAIEKHFYMDDYLQAFPDIETATRTIFEINEIHKAAAFQLRGWASNEPDALVATESLRREQKALSIGDHTERTLGLIWKTKNDTLSFSLNLRNCPREVIQGYRPPTKREVTSAVMSVFDPIGFAAPITVLGKC
ncbi:hypothetical protein EVAR_84013_1 [Eumeta japonica]|nr:hypothetical protein EVAR_84013_1 [Eumeta japonica]